MQFEKAIKSHKTKIGTDQFTIIYSLGRAIFPRVGNTLTRNRAAMVILIKAGYVVISKMIGRKEVESEPTALFSLAPDTPKKVIEAAENASFHIGYDLLVNMSKKQAEALLEKYATKNLHKLVTRRKLQIVEVKGKQVKESFITPIKRIDGTVEFQELPKFIEL